MLIRNIMFILHWNILLIVKMHYEKWKIGSQYETVLGIEHEVLKKFGIWSTLVMNQCKIAFFLSTIQRSEMSSI